ncbi:Hypothetical protein, putative, partial [Bodo saltans]
VFLSSLAACMVMRSDDFALWAIVMSTCARGCTRMFDPPRESIGSNFDVVVRVQIKKQCFFFLCVYSGSPHSSFPFNHLFPCCSLQRNVVTDFLHTVA